MASLLWRSGVKILAMSMVGERLVEEVLIFVMMLDTIRREVKEEYCTNASDIEFLGYRDVHREHTGEPTHWIALDFKVRIDPSLVQNGEPHK